MKTVDIYKDKLFIRFDKTADIFKPITTYPHYKEWTKILRYLKKRGFTIKTPKCWEKEKYGKAEHKVAFKGNVVFCLEMMSWQIGIEFGDVKNLWDLEFNFWSLTDDRSKPLTYLESKKIQLEVKKLITTFPKELLVYNDVELTPTEKILKGKRESCHSRDLQKLDELGLEGVQYQMSEYDVKNNSTDRNKKQVLNGELKYYYTYKRKLVCGRVYHQLNNRWIVLLPDGLDYVSSWELFDFKGEPRRKPLTKEEKINRLEKELKKSESKKHYLKCIEINKQLENLKGSEKTYHVWSLKHEMWWGENDNGYTSDKRNAGVYLESNILGNQSYYNNGTSTKAVLI